MDLNGGAPSQVEIFVLPNPARVRTIVFWLVFAALGAFVAVRSASWGYQALGAAWVILAVLACFRIWCSAIRCDSSGIVALDDLRTRRVPWSGVERFEERGLRGIGVRLRKGQWVRLMGYATLGDESPEMATENWNSNGSGISPTPGKI